MRTEEEIRKAYAQCAEYLKGRSWCSKYGVLSMLIQSAYVKTMMDYFIEKYKETI